MLDKQLLHFDGCDNRHLHKQLKQLWYDNGNTLSMQYSGSLALKSYFIRNKRQGAMDSLKDGLLGVRRYFINRLCHGSLQTTYDILTADLDGKRMSFYRDGLPTIKRVFVGMLLAVCAAAWSSGTTIMTLMLSVVAVSLAMLAMVLVFMDAFIQKPRP